jgi:cell division protein ZapA
MPSRVVHVDIYGQRYAVRSDLDPQYVGELAGYFDARMQQAARELQTGDPLRIAVIAALNLADELFRSRADATGLERRVVARAADLERLVDDVLAVASERAIAGG